MTTLSEYLSLLPHHTSSAIQVEWFQRLRSEVKNGAAIFDSASEAGRTQMLAEFWNRVRTEEIKAWYNAPEGDMLFQGTSVSALTIPCELSNPLMIGSIEYIEKTIADHYIRLHDKHEAAVRTAFNEDIERWIRAGLFFGVVISSKILSQAFALKVPFSDVVFDIRGASVDPHEIISFPQGIREEYFALAKERIDCFGQMDLSREELESSLVLSDISKPRIETLKDHLLLAPVRCNDIACIMSNRICNRIIEATNGRISPPSLAVVIYDTDTPYTYHHLLRCNGNPAAPILPGLTVLGSSGTVDAVRWLYLYRMSLIAQKIQKSSLYSEIHRCFTPFVFFGVLVPRDADILLDMHNLGQLRYRGNIDPELELYFVLPTIAAYVKKQGGLSAGEKIEWKTRLDR